MKLGMGWIGWSEEETLHAHMTSILLAYEGRIDMLKAIFGGRSTPPTQPPVEDLAKQTREEFSAAGLNVVRFKRK